MPRSCTVCTHPERLAIDQALVDGRSSYDLAAVYALSHDAITRHNASHVPEHLKKARQDADKEQALDIVKQLKAINMATLAVLHDARLAAAGTDGVDPAIGLAGQRVASRVAIAVQPYIVSLFPARLRALAVAIN
jgi:hypothetical protein